LLVGGFGLYLMSLGLPFLPESVLRRSLVAGTGMQLAQARLGGLLQAVYTNVRVNLLAYGGMHILSALVLSAWGAARGIRDLAERRVQQAKLIAAGFLAVVGLAQIFAGSLVSVSRYEIYVLALCLGTLMVVFAVETNTLLHHLSSLGRLGLCLSILVLGAGYAFRAVDAVKGARAMQLLDGTISRFLVEVWREPVAVSGFGRLTWRNPWGAVPVQLSEFGTLLPEEVDRKAQLLVAHYGIRLAVLDATSAAPVPNDWEKVAELRLPGGGPLGSNLYAVHAEDKAAITKALQRFWETLSTPAVLRLPPKVVVLRD
jgi:hypothetical protein